MSGNDFAQARDACAPLPSPPLSNTNAHERTHAGLTQRPTRPCAGIAQLLNSMRSEMVAHRKGAPNSSSSSSSSSSVGRVAVHNLSPGMVLTDLLLEGASSAQKRAFNVLCDYPETVAGGFMRGVCVGSEGGVGGGGLQPTLSCASAGCVYASFCAQWQGLAPPPGSLSCAPCEERSGQGEPGAEHTLPDVGKDSREAAACPLAD